LNIRFFILFYFIFVGWWCHLFGNKADISSALHQEQKLLSEKKRQKIEHAFTKNLINEDGELTFHSSLLGVVNFSKKINDLRGRSFVINQLSAALRSQKNIDARNFDEMLWFWLKSGVKEFEEIIEQKRDQIRDYFPDEDEVNKGNKGVNGREILEKAFLCIKKGKGDVVQAYFKTKKLMEWLDAFWNNESKMLEIFEIIRRNLNTHHQDLNIAIAVIDRVQYWFQYWLDISVKEWRKESQPKIQLSDAFCVKILWQSYLFPGVVPLLTAEEFFGKKVIDERIKKVIFNEVSDKDSYRSFLKNYIQPILKDQVQFSEKIQKHLIKTISEGLKDFLYEEIKFESEKFDKLINQLSVACYFIQHFKEYKEFSDLIQIWLTHDAVKIVQKYCHSIKIISLFHKVCTPFQGTDKNSMHECTQLMEKGINWIQKFFQDEKIKNSDIEDQLESKLKLAVQCMEAGEPFFSIAHSWLSKSDTQRILDQALAGEKFLKWSSLFQSYLRKIGLRELLLIYLYAFK